MIGRVIGGYRVEGVVGRGGMGVVYRAEQLALGRIVALKVVAPEFAADPAFRERFTREARLAASIEHPHVIPIHETGSADGMLFISMRLIEGGDMRAAIGASGPLAPVRAAGIVAQIGGALDAAHARGLVHRDVKPANVILGRGDGGDHAYLTDFGLVKHMAATSGPTQAGVWVGTVDYAAPEQVEAQRLDARTDVYALGCVLYQALTGRVPFPRDSDIAKIYAKLNDEPQPPSTLAAVSPELDEVVMRALARRPDDRFPSAGDLGRAAIAAARGQTVETPERSVAVGDAAPDSRAHTRALSTAPAFVPPPPAPPPLAAPTWPEQPPAPPRRRGLGFVLAGLALAAVGAAVAVLLASGVLSSDDEADPTTAPTTTTVSTTTTRTAPGSTPEETTTEEADPTPSAVRSFRTPSGDGGALPAAYCRLEVEALYCWTPNDGYTFVTGDEAPYRLPEEEAANKDSAPSGTTEIAFGETVSIGSFECTSGATELGCRSATGYSWRLPRFKGLPTAFGPDGQSLGPIE